MLSVLLLILARAELSDNAAAHLRPWKRNTAIEARQAKHVPNAMPWRVCRRKRNTAVDISARKRMEDVGRNGSLERIGERHWMICPQRSKKTPTLPINGIRLTRSHRSGHTSERSRAQARHLKSSRWIWRTIQNRNRKKTGPALKCRRPEHPAQPRIQHLRQHRLRSKPHRRQAAAIRQSP